MKRPELAIALDFLEYEKAENFLSLLEEKDLIIKIGYSLYFKYGPKIINLVKKFNYKIFLDLKLYDIPNTVANAVKQISDMNIDFLTLHLCGGIEMLESAVMAKENKKLKLLGVTVLTSHDKKYLEFIGSKYNLSEFVKKLTDIAYNCGIDGVVCSVNDLDLIKNKKLIKATPGIRLDGNLHDQKRVATVQKAIEKGSDILIMGRPVIFSDNPNEIIKHIKRKMNNNN